MHFKQQGAGSSAFSIISPQCWNLVSPTACQEPGFLDFHDPPPPSHPLRAQAEVSSLLWRLKGFRTLISFNNRRPERGKRRGRVPKARAARSPCKSHALKLNLRGKQPLQTPTATKRGRGEATHSPPPPVRWLCWNPTLSVSLGILLLLSE
ncbi:unnamed protein product [Eretmochelys imbricata]